MEILDAQKFTYSLLLIGLLLSALNVLSLFPQAPRSGRGALRRGPERGLFIKISTIFLQYENLDISLSKTTEILRNSGKNPLKFDEKHAKSASSSENQQKMHEILQKWCKGPEKSQKSGMVQRKKCRA